MAYSTRYLPGKDDVRGELDNLAADIAARTEPDLLTSIQVSSRVDASANQQLRLKPPPGGMALTLPAPQQGSMGDEVIVILEDPEGPLRVTALPFQEGSRGAVIRNTVNGGETATFTSSGRIVFASNGDTRWLTTNELPNEAPQVQAADDSAAAFGDAEVLLGSASVAFPNGRVATDSTEIDADTTLVGLISWALKVASVGLSKLEDLTGLSVLGRAASSAGVMAAITATAARQVLRANNAGNALEWGFPIEVQDESVDQGDVHTINFTDGINATVAAGVATVNALPQLRVVSFTGGLLDVSTFNHNDTIILNCASSSPFTLTGITARSEGTRFFVVVNATGNDGRVLVEHEAASVAATERFRTPFNIEYYTPEDSGFVTTYTDGGAGGRWRFHSDHAITVQDAGVAVGTRPILNIADSTSIVGAASEVVASDRIDVSFQRAAISGDITIPLNSNTAAITTNVIVDADVNTAAAIAQTKLGATTGFSVKASGSAATSRAHRYLLGKRQHERRAGND
jgi:hypothetical protein